MIRYLDPGELLEIHLEVLAATGGADGVRDTGLLESAVARPQAGFGGQDLYPTIADKAAALIHSLIKNHPFIDGNKRTSFTAMDVFLRINGFRLNASEEDKYTFVIGIASGDVSFSDISPWITNHLGKV